MLTTYLIVDDFFDDPAAVRRNMLDMDYPEPRSNAYYPGRDSAQQLKLPGIDELVSSLTGEKVVESKLLSHGHARISLAADDLERKATVHIDPGVVWSAIIYMNLPEQCQGGTEFFRHKAWNMERAPIYPRELAEMDVQNYVDGSVKIIGQDSNDMNKWERTMIIPMRFNRLVLLRPWYFHTSGASFGDNKENGRLVYLMFFDGVS
ncbi:MAG: DUF6445 family protein [Alphaproteobacteria bacterium]|nr:DUF6445 family protein [Alphaproteobacteria bacterium]